ncbi:MAG TPA: hypothetical protein VND21_04935 [Planctomycetota bacterium]|nr:hypothetical protein [Planctomycetota bacterium]
MTTPIADLWHRAGRSARDHRKRLLALYGVTLSPVALVLAVLAHRVLTGVGLDLAGLRRPITWVLGPLRDAWMGDQDLSALLWVLLAALALSVVWGFFGGAISRMAAVDLSSERREPPGAALAFARRHARGFIGAKATLWAGALVPLGGAILVSYAGRLPDPFGSLLLVPAVLVVAVLVVGAVVAASLGAAAGFLSSPTIACEDSDAFDAVSRVYGYAAAGLPRLVGVRLVFLGGVLLGSGWRALRTGGALLLGALAIEAGAGEDRLDRLLAAARDLGASGGRASAGDRIAAATLALVAGGLVAFWVADLVCRVLCGRVGAYLALRQAVDGVPPARLRTAGAAAPRLDAEQAGFVEVARIGAPTRRPARGAP